MLYFDMTSGISGDIALALLSQHYGGLEEFSAEVSSLLKTKVQLLLQNVFVNGILCKRLSIDIEKEPHIHRNFRDIKNIIFNSDFEENIKTDAIKIFELIAEAEGKIHGKSIDEVHFHEVGAIDSIIDILGASWFYNKLKRPEIVASKIKIGSGIVKSAHGLIPVPAPATLEIIKGVEFKRIDIDEELTTPTGAALMKYFSTKFTNDISGNVENIFYATGTKTFESLPNISRLLVLSEIDKSDEGIVVVETNIDDMPSEFFDNVMKQLFDCGCKDVFFTPVFMKKNRPACKISALVESRHLDTVAAILLQQTSSFGLRYYNVNRIIAEREFKEVDYQGHKINVKYGNFKDFVKFSPEYEDVVKVAEKIGEPPYEIYKKIIGMLYRGQD
ncbi:nickel pincer cofactor biosynthesis protein LarC [Deferribacteraceae bacterium V6Fe1]|nr:nickel pincer cofactor biosynthesis protein LarC [Deferribacteraceae bacterium V6Fe1]